MGLIVLGETHVLPGRSGCREAQACAAWTFGEGARSSIIIAQGTGLLRDRQRAGSSAGSMRRRRTPHRIVSVGDDGRSSVTTGTQGKGNQGAVVLVGAASVRVRPRCARFVWV